MKRLVIVSPWFALLLASPLLASTARVPDDFGTIQAAVDAGLADTIVVRSVSETESVIIRRDLVLLADTAPPVPLASIGTARGDGGWWPSLTLRGFHVLGSASLALGDVGTVSDCLFDAGLDCSGADLMEVSRCVVSGDLAVHDTWRFAIEDNSIRAGGISEWNSLGTSAIVHNDVRGPAPIGIRAGEDTYVYNNSVRSCEVGIQKSFDGLGGNLVEDCVTGITGNTTCSGDTVRRCVMNGIDLGDGYTPLNGVSDCVVDSVGGIGIKVGRALHAITRNRVRHTGSHGIVAGEAYPGASDNVVVDAGGDGIRLGWVIDPGMVERNVVGRCMGAGLVAPGGRRNTSYLNGGEGFIFLGGEVPDTVALNVAYRNGGPGLRWSGSAIPYLGCNDWFENAGAATVGVDPSPSDLNVDPMFCDVFGDRVGLMEGSPLADAAGCGLIGAVGVECQVNRAPDIAAATATVNELWPPDHRFVRVGIRGVMDPDGDVVTILVLGVTQDEPVVGAGAGTACPDAVVDGSGAMLRAERSARGNGRVYRVEFTADDGHGGRSRGEVAVCVPHDRGRGGRCVDDGRRFDSLGPCRVNGSISWEDTDVTRINDITMDGHRATIGYALAAECEIDLAVFDVAGRRVATLARGLERPGSHEVVWNAAGHARGVYFGRLRAGGMTMTRRIVIPN